MADAEVIILSRDGREAILGKLRSAGDEALAWFNAPGNLDPDRFHGLWSAFIATRTQGRPDPSSRLDSSYWDTGFIFDVPAHRPGAAPDFQALRAEAERLIRQADPTDAYLDGWAARCILVDLGPRLRAHPVGGGGRPGWARWGGRHCGSLCRGIMGNS